MPSLCEYGMCHRVSSSIFYPFCSEAHKLYAERKEILEKLCQIEEKIKQLHVKSNEISNDKSSGNQ
jgi:hypothetical protein